MGETFPENEKQTHFRELSLTPRPPLPKMKSKGIFGRGGEYQFLIPFPPLLKSVFLFRRGG